MLLASSQSPLGRESRQAPVIVSDFGPSDVGRLPTAAYPSQRRKKSQPKPQGNLPRELANSETELESFIGSALFLEVGSGVRVGVCVCEHAPGLNWEPGVTEPSAYSSVTAG